jgi:PAS domain S-box-containing protein
MNKQLGVKHLFQSKASFSSTDILNLLPVAVYTSNKEGSINYFNEMAVKLWGYRPNLGDPLLKYCACYKIFVDGVYISPEKSPMAIALETGQPFKDLQALVQRPDGSTFHALVTIDLIYDEENKIIGAVNAFRDVSEIRKEQGDIRDSEIYMRQQLEQSEERYHKMIEEVEDYAIILLDKNGVILNWNKGAEKIKGYKEEEIIGKNFREFYLPEDQQSGLPFKLLNEAKEKGKALYEGWRKRKDSSIFWGSVVLTALHNDLGEVIGFSKVTRDLTANKQAEDRLSEYLKQLEFKNKELEQFVYAASHDMKEPLRKIHLYNSYIASNSSNILDEKSKEYFARSIQATQRMTGLIEDLLSYSKITTIDESLETVDLNVIVDELSSFYKEEFEQKGITFERDKLPIIKAIPFQLKQLLSNLIDNSIKYKHPEREGYIRLAAEKINSKALKSTTGLFQQYYKITVSDNGIGFDPSYAAKIFELFQRLPTTSTVKGSGIGLAICKRIVQNHNGWIEATGKMGEGAIFSFYLPVA